jgi:hypothetical protein
MEEARLQTLAQARYFWTGQRRWLFRCPRQSGIGLLSMCASDLALPAMDVAVLAEMDVRSPSWDSMRITARSTSITKSPGSWKRYGPSSPHHAPDTPTIPLGGVQERRSCAQTSGRCPNSQHGAGLVNDLCANHLDPHVNFRRPCFFLETITDATGKERRGNCYEEMKTPDEKLKSRPYAGQYPKPASPLNN